MRICGYLKEKLTTNKIVVAFEQNGNNVKSSLIKILSKEKIGGGKFGTIYNSNIKIGNKNRRFAIKEFLNKDGDPDKNILIHKKLKDIGIPTRTTYRKIISDNSLLMTLGNKDDSYLFSSNNGSLDSGNIKKNKIEKIDNLNEFYESAYDIIKKLTVNHRNVYFDAYMFKYKDNKLDLIVGDFDVIENSEEDLHFLSCYNIKEFYYSLLEASKFFVMNDGFSTGFAYFLLGKQKKGDLFLSGINLESIFSDEDNSHARKY